MIPAGCVIDGEAVVWSEGRLNFEALQGGEAHTLWKRFTRKYPRVAAKYTAVETYHPGRTALRDPDPAVREARAMRRFEAFREVRRILDNNSDRR